MSVIEFSLESLVKMYFQIYSVVKTCPPLCKFFLHKQFTTLCGQGHLMHHNTYSYSLLHGIQFDVLIYLEVHLPPEITKYSAYIP